MTVEKGLVQVINRDGTYTMKEGTTYTFNSDDITSRTINEDGSVTFEYKNGEQFVVSSEYLSGDISFKL